MNVIVRQTFGTACVFPIAIRFAWRLHDGFVFKPSLGLDSRAKFTSWLIWEIIILTNLPKLRANPDPTRKTRKTKIPAF